MGTYHTSLRGLIMVVFFAGTVGLVLAPASQALDFFEKKAFPQAGPIKKFFEKMVCGFENPGQRFVTSKDGKEVCDRTTGNIWEQDLDTFHPTNNPDGRVPMDWQEAIAFCANLDKGHGKVYELPTIQQLVSVLDYMQNSPALTPGVFSNVLRVTPLTAYWSATPNDVSDAWCIIMEGGFVNADCGKGFDHAWCVRRD